MFFRDGKLITAKRDIQFSNGDSEKAIEALYSLIAKFEGDGHRVCHLKTYSISGTDHTLKTGTLGCGQKFIEVEVMRSDTGNVIMYGMSEVLNESPLIP
jgi:hypothetical protein